VTPAAAALMGAIRVYRVAVSPLLGNNCRFLPSCSEYALMAIHEWGAVRGSWLAARRILRCHPFHPGGLDLPPQRPTRGRGEEVGHVPAGASPSR
jgi:uncharacterized protein